MNDSSYEYSSRKPRALKDGSQLGTFWSYSKEGVVVDTKGIVARQASQEPGFVEKAKALFSAAARSAMERGQWFVLHHQDAGHSLLLSEF